MCNFTAWRCLHDLTDITTNIHWCHFICKMKSKVFTANKVILPPLCSIRSNIFCQSHVSWLSCFCILNDRATVTLHDNVLYFSVLIVLLGIHNYDIISVWKNSCLLLFSHVFCSFILQWGHFKWHFKALLQSESLPSACPLRSLLEVYYCKVAISY